jgi:maltodextrin utilization protein YvdJ
MFINEHVAAPDAHVITHLTSRAMRGGRSTMSDKTYTATALAAEIGVNPKSLRGYLRKNFTRMIEAKNTSWIITEEAAEAARAHFAKQETPKA